MNKISNSLRNLATSYDEFENVQNECAKPWDGSVDYKKLFRNACNLDGKIRQGLSEVAVFAGIKMSAFTETTPKIVSDISLKPKAPKLSLPKPEGYNFSEKERKIISLLPKTRPCGRFLDIQDIADITHWSKAYCNTMRGRIYKKLNVHSREEAVNMIRRENLV